MISPKSMSAAAALVALVTAAASPARPATDWTSFGFDNQRTGYNPREATLGTANIHSLKQLWATDLGGPTLTQPTVATGVATAAGTRDLVYAATLPGRVAALDRVTGAVVWQKQFPALHNRSGDYPKGIATFIATPALDRARHAVYLVASDGTLHALDEASGGELAGWPVKITPKGLKDFVIAGLTLVGTSLYVATASCCDKPPYRGEAIRVDVTGPKVTSRWFVEGMGGPSGGGIWGPGGLSAEPGGTALYAATGNSLGTPESFGYAEHVVRLSPSLGVQAAHYPGLSGRDVDFGATPLLYQAAGCSAQLAVMNKSGVLLVYDRGGISGGARQRLQMGDISLGAERNFIGVPAYDPAHQLILVNLTGGASPYKTGLVALHVGADCSLRRAYQRGLVGRATWTVAYPSIPPTVANGVVFVARSNSAKVYALDAASGAVLWTSGRQIRGGVYAAPTVVNGQLLIGAYDNKLHAFGP